MAISSLTRFSMAILMMMIFIIPQTFLWMKLPFLGVVLVWMLVEGTRDRWKIRSGAFLPYYLIFCFLTVAWCIVGLARVNPEIAIVEALRVYVIYMVIFCVLALYVSNLDYQAHADRIVIAGAFGIGLVASYALLDHLFQLGWLSQQIMDDMYLQVGLHSGYVQMNNVNIGMLTFIVPYLLSRVLLGERNERRTWLLLGLAVAVLSAVLASRRVVLVLLVITPLLAFALTLLAGHARQRHLRRFVQFYTFPLLIAGSGSLAMIYGGFDFLDGFAVRVASAFTTDPDAPRPQQHAALMAAFADSYFWGSGFGGLTSVIRSDERPWTYELTYSRLLFNGGLLGVGLLLLFFCTYLLLTLRKIRHGAHASIHVSLLTGFLTVLIAAASNPYLSSFDFLFALSIIPLILNTRDMPGQRFALDEGPPAVSAPRKVAAVVTTFQGGESIRPNLERIVGQVDVLVIVDDSGDPSREGASTFLGMEKAIFLRNEDNLGIAAALNRGIAQAGAMGCDWIITLDDDTLVSKTYLDDVFHFVQTGAQPRAGLIACSREGSVPSAMDYASGYKIKRTLITSGCVFEFRTFQEIGGFDEGLFIDLVDFDFCTRLRQSGRSLVLLNKPGMAHRVGSARTVRLVGLAIVAYHHAPFRLYYQMRNVFLFARKHLAFDPVLSLYLLLDALRLPLKALFFEQQKRARFFYLGTGLLDGLRGRAGRLTRRFAESS